MIEFLSGSIWDVMWFSVAAVVAYGMGAMSKAPTLMVAALVVLLLARWFVDAVFYLVEKCGGILELLNRLFSGLSFEYWAI